MRALAIELYPPGEVVKHFADCGIALSERELRRLARSIGACRQIGKAMFFTATDIQRIIDASAEPGAVDPCQKSTNEARSGITLSRSPDAAFDRVQRRLDAMRRSKSPQPTKPGNVVPLSSASKRR